MLQQDSSDLLRPFSILLDFDCSRGVVELAVLCVWHQISDSEKLCWNTELKPSLLQQERKGLLFFLN